MDQASQEKLLDRLYSLQSEQKQMEFASRFDDLDRKTKEAQLAQLLKPEEKDRYVTLGEGQTLYDLSSLQALFTNPKTYKPTGGSSGDDLNNLFQQYLRSRG